MKKYPVNIEKKFASSINSIKLIEPIIYQVKKTVTIPDSIIYNILIAVTEAVNNAIIHGNKQNITKQVLIKLLANIHELVIEVTDEGSGFEIDSLADPRIPENLLKANGRGVFIIKELSNESKFDISEKGTTVTMKFILN